MTERNSTPLVAVYQAGNTYAEISNEFGDFDRWFIDAIVRHGARTTVVDVREKNYPSLKRIDGLMVTGSPASVCTDPPEWTTSLLDHLREVMAKDIPALGVCYGHQAFARAAGGEVQRHHETREIGTVSLSLTPAGKRHPLFRGIPGTFKAQETHEDVVTALPGSGGVQVLAENSHNSYQALAFSANVFSVQFHPEITADIMRAYMRIYGNKMMRKGELTRREFAALRENIEETETGNTVIGNFIDHLRQQ